MMKSDSNDSRIGEALARASLRRDSSPDGHSGKIPPDRLGALLSLVEARDPSRRPDWESAATLALRREILRRDDICSPEAREIPASVRRHLLGRVRDESGRMPHNGLLTRAHPVSWLLPMAACVLVALAILSLRHSVIWRPFGHEVSNSTQPARAWPAQVDLSDLRPENSEFEESFLDRTGLSDRRETDVSFTKLVVVDERFLEPRVFLSNSFHFAIGQDLAAVETDGG